MGQKFVGNSGAVSNTGYKRQIDVNMSAIEGLIITPDNASIDTETNARLEATWKTKIKAASGNRFYPFPSADSVTPQSQEDIYMDSPFKGQVFVREGKDSFTLNVDPKSPTYQSILRTFNDGSYKVFLIDSNQNIWGTSSNGTLIEGFSINLLRIQKMGLVEAANKPLTPIKITLNDPTEWNDRGIILENLTWNPLNLQGLYDVDLAASLYTTAGVTVSVNIAQIAVNTPASQITGLAKEDFVIKIQSTGAVKTISAATDNGDGTYTLACTMTSVAHTVDLVAPSAISIEDPGIESTGLVTFTVPA